MRSTFTKIFLSFWLTELLILICTVFILTNQFESNEAVYTSSYAMLLSNARLSVAAYERGGCDALQVIPNVFYLEKPTAADQPAILFDIQGRALCQQVDEKLYGPLFAKIKQQGYLIPERHGASYMEGIAFKNELGHKYAYMIRDSYPTRIYIPYSLILPRLLIGLIVSVMVTFGITMIITRPIGSLREAARQLAAGN